VILCTVGAVHHDESISNRMEVINVAYMILVPIDKSLHIKAMEQSNPLFAHDDISYHFVPFVLRSSIKESERYIILLISDGIAEPYGL
jgi:hypothetical protein